MQTIDCSRKNAHARAASMARRFGGCLAALIAGVFAASSAWALPSCPVYPSPITACCVADQPGQTYAMGQDLTSGGACIKISAPRVMLSMNGYTITSTNSTPTKGIGVHVLSTAPNAVFIGGTAIQGFKIGFETDAANTLSIVPNGLLGQRGVIFNGPNGLALEPVAEANLKNGIILTPAASGSFMYVMESASNGGNGIVLNRTTAVTVDYVLSEQNTGYGLWLKGASSNSVIDGDLEGNTIAGAYVGCHAGGPSSAACTIPPSNNNTFLVSASSSGFLVGSCPNDTQVDQQYGIVIDQGNVKNRVAGVSADNSSSCASPGDVKYDGYDGNPEDNCRNNRWFANNFNSENHTPTAANPFCMDGPVL